jgi:hypothetical protein
MSDTVLDGTGEHVPGHRVLEGTDLEIAYNISGDNRVVRINKGPVQIFRVMLVDGAMGRAVGLDAEQMAKLEAKAREIAP